ncbi:MAG: iron-sulfur cluster assembly protein [Phycisphaeraceae bacterium]
MSKAKLTVNGNDQGGQSSGPPPSADKADDKRSDEPKTLKDKVIDALHEVYDPELPANIYELGLIYGVDISDGGKVNITMTLTSPACPAAQEIPLAVRSQVARLAEVTDVDVEIVFDPPWNPDMMSPIAKVQLGMF